MNKNVIIFLRNIGVLKKEELSAPFSYNIYDYDLKKNADKIDVHKNFLYSVLQEENNRLNIIEGKTTQIISQTSIVFSLVGLIIPILIDKFSSINVFVKVIIILFLLVGFFFYLNSISNALKNFNLKKYKYPYSNPSNVIDFKDKTIEEFNSEIVRDYLYSINKTIQINNVKGSNLISAYLCFKIANIFTGIIILIICSLILFVNSNKEEGKNIQVVNKTISIKN